MALWHYFFLHHSIFKSVFHLEFSVQVHLLVLCHMTVFAQRHQRTKINKYWQKKSLSFSHCAIEGHLPVFELISNKDSILKMLKKKIQVLFQRHKYLLVFLISTNLHMQSLKKYLSLRSLTWKERDFSWKFSLFLWISYCISSTCVRNGITENSGQEDERTVLWWHIPHP